LHLCKKYPVLAGATLKWFGGNYDHLVVMENHTLDSDIFVNWFISAGVRGLSPEEADALISGIRAGGRG